MDKTITLKRKEDDEHEAELSTLRQQLAARDAEVARLRGEMSTAHGAIQAVGDGMSAKHTTNYHAEPVCPHCGDKQNDPWEVNFGGLEGDAELTCESCEKEFICSRSVTFYYSTAAKAVAKWVAE